MNKTILSNDQHNFRYSAAVQEINESLKCVEDVNLVIRSKIKGVKKLVKTCSTIQKKIHTNNQKLLRKIHQKDITVDKYKNKLYTEKQLRVQFEEYTVFQDEQIANLENDVIQCQLENENIRSENDVLLKRINFSQEIKNYENEEKCKQYDKLIKLINYIKTYKNINSMVKFVEEILKMLSSSKEGMCVICQDNRSDMAFYPCGHLCVCYECCTKLDNKCPYCNCTTKYSSRIYQV